MIEKPVSPMMPQPGERALIVGQTGSGKTVFNIWLMERIPTAPIIIYDTKIEPKFEALPRSRVVETIAQMADAYHDVTIDYIVVRPSLDLMTDPEALDKYLYYHYLHFHHSVAYIDEGVTFHNTNGRAYIGLIGLMTRGRSKGITTILSTQRPRGISRTLLSESQKFFIFRVQDKDDRKRLGDVIPEFANMPLPPKHAFYFFESGEDAPQLFKPVKLDKRFDTGYVDVSAPEPGANELETDGPKPLPHIWI